MHPKDAAQERSFFDQVVDASGLSSVIAHAAIARACVRAGVDSTALNRENLHLVIPHLERTLEIYLRDQAAPQIRAIRCLAGRTSWRPGV